MTSSALEINSSKTTEQTESKPEKQYLNLTRQEWLTPVLFLLSMSLMGLMFPLGYLFVPIFLISRYRKDKYDFIIMLTLFLGGYGLLGERNIPFKTEDLALLVSFVSIFIYRKNGVMMKALVAFFLYVLAVFWIATCSDERMAVQIRTMRNYWGFIYFMVPLVVFANEKFDIKIFFRKLFPYVLTICSFYVIDGFILCGHILLPNTHIWGENVMSTFYSPILHPLSFHIARIYPPGLYLMTLCILPICKYYKLTKGQWAIVLLALAASQTFTVISGFIGCYVLMQGKAKQLLKYLLLALVAFVLLYFVDSALPVSKDNRESTLRIKSSIDQFTALYNAADDEDLSEFASGRFAQVMPKFELMYNMHKEWVGLGFLHADLTKMAKYQITNEYYFDNTQSDEVATGIEIIPLQVIISIGYIGLLIHILFFAYTYYLVRKMEYSKLYLSVLLAFSWFGLGGFSGLILFPGLALAGLTFAVVLLNDKSKESNS
jgi:hypothetical protein